MPPTLCHTTSNASGSFPLEYSQKQPNDAKGKTVEQTEQNIIKNTPRKTEFFFNLHHWFILHGRYTCLARKPKCGSCIVEDLCDFKEKTS